MTQEIKATDDQFSKASRDKIKTYSVQIEQTWHKTLESIFAIGDLLIRAETDLKKEKDAYEFLINSLSFGSRTAQRLVAIAKTSHFRKPAVQKALPACWTILYELRGLSETKFNRALKNKTITTGMTRDQAKALTTPFSKQNAVKSDKEADTSDQDDTYANLIFSLRQSSDYTNQKALMDVQFICNLICDLFDNSTSKSKLKVSSDTVKPSKKLRASEEVFTELIAQVRKVENHKRKLQGKAPLSKLQEIVSLFGVDPDNLGKSGFSLLERLAVSYAKRNGINCIKDDQLRWSAARSDIEPELLGSFMNEVEKQISEMLSTKKSKQRRTEVIELDVEGDEIKRKSRDIINAQRSA
jgi:hypothetical protein